jgi:protein gp37
MGVTSIQWTDRSANPIRARHKVTGKVGWHCVMPSPGCAHCYSHTLNGRFGTGLPYNKRSEDEIELFLDLKSMEALRRRRGPSKVFLCDMTDIFGEFVPFEWVDQIFDYIAISPQHTFQILTKRPARMAEYFRGGRPALGNVWLGTSVEDQRRARERVGPLLSIPAVVHFISAEPILGEIDFGDVECTSQLDSEGANWYDALKGRSYWSDGEYGVAGPAIDWVIVGGESGPHARPCDVAWIRSIRDQCRAAGVACFIKQLGARPFDSAGADHLPDVHRKLSIEEARRPENLELLGDVIEAMFVRTADPKGGDIDEWPPDLQIREFPR